MNKKLNNILFSFCVYGLLAVCISSAAATDISTSFQGRVISDTNEPVAGAYIFAELTSPSNTQPKNNKKITIQTDQDGFFKIDQPAASIKITNIRKEGYRFQKKDAGNLIFDLTKDQAPAIFKINKSKQPAQVQSMHTYVVWASKTSNYSFDLTQRGFPAPKPKKAVTKPQPPKKGLARIKAAITNLFKSEKPNEIPNTEIKITTTKIEDEDAYSMQFQAPDKDSGIIISDELLAQAPESGYESKTELTIDSQSPETRKYLYVKAAEESIYSRITLSAKPGPKNMLVKIACLSNLNGSKTFPVSIPDDARPRSKPQQRWHSEQKRRDDSRQKRKQRLEMLNNN